MNHNIQCRFCGSNKISDLHVHSRLKTRVYYSCRKCTRERASRYRKTPSGKLSVSNSVNKYNVNNPQRHMAWRACVKLGTKPCETCGDEKTDKHHPDINYSLDVVWLCRYHHKLAHIAYKI